MVSGQAGAIRQFRAHRAQEWTWARWLLLLLCAAEVRLIAKSTGVIANSPPQEHAWGASPDARAEVPRALAAFGRAGSPCRETTRRAPTGRCGRGAATRHAYEPASTARVSPTNRRKISAQYTCRRLYAADPNLESLRARPASRRRRTRAGEARGQWPELRASRPTRLRKAHVDRA